jgi:hypothetical protein
MSDEVDMATSPCIQCRVDPQLKLGLQAIAVKEWLQPDIDASGRADRFDGKHPMTHSLP